MVKFLAVAMVVVVALTVVQAIVTADEGGRAQASTSAQGINLRAGGSVTSAAVPAVPTPPGVIGLNSPLPCTTPGAGLLGAKGWSREIGESR